MTRVRPPRAAVAGLAGLLACGGSARAGWVTITNSTPLVLVVQDAVGDHPTTTDRRVRPKTIRLLPGEVYREFHAADGKKAVQVFDARQPARPVFRGQLEWAADDLNLSLEPDGLQVKLAGLPPSPVVPDAAAIVKVSAPSPDLPPAVKPVPRAAPPTAPAPPPATPPVRKKSWWKPW